MWKMGVPVATPVRFGEYMAAVRAITAGDESRSSLERDAASFLGVPYARSTNLGRSAVYFALRALAGMSGRSEVVVPAYVCPSVGRAVLKAGLKPVLCDVGADGSGLDADHLERVASDRTLAVVAAHLYGYPTDLTDVLRLARSCGAMVIEDAAQAFSAKWRGRFVGTNADVGIYSFALSKVLGGMGGGLIVTCRPEVGSRIDSAMEATRAMSVAGQAVALARAAVVGALIRSRHLGPIDAVWSRALRGKSDAEDFVAGPASSVSAHLIRALLRKVSGITTVRARNAAVLASHLGDYEGLVLPRIIRGTEPVFLRYSVVVEDREDQRRLMKELRRRGINATTMYSRPSYDLLRALTSDYTSCPRAEYLCEHMLNLPTHPYLRDRDLEEMLRAFEVVLGSRRKRSTVYVTSAAGVM